MALLWNVWFSPPFFGFRLSEEAGGCSSTQEGSWTQEDPDPAAVHPAGGFPQAEVRLKNVHAGPVSGRL